MMYTGQNLLLLISISMPFIKYVKVGMRKVASFNISIKLRLDYLEWRVKGTGTKSTRQRRAAEQKSGNIFLAHCLHYS